MSPTAFGYPGATPSVSANGTANGIVWAIANGNPLSTLYAYDATNLTNQLFQISFADNVYNKYVTPLVANGRVYVGTPNMVVVFGLLNP